MLPAQNGGQPLNNLHAVVERLFKNMRSCENKLALHDIVRLIGHYYKGNGEMVLSLQQFVSAGSASSSILLLFHTITITITYNFIYFPTIVPMVDCETVLWQPFYDYGGYRRCLTTLTV